MFNMKNKKYSIFQFRRELTFARIMIIIAAWSGFVLGIICQKVLG